MKTREELQARIDEINHAVNDIMLTSCAGDQKHCTCVPLLRLALDKANKAIRQIEQIKLSSLALNCDKLACNDSCDHGAHDDLILKAIKQYRS